jgi:DNA-binding response OmpR family regulator
VNKARTVLVVEDEATTRNMLKTALEANGHDVLLADAAAAGLHLFSQRKPDMVILDVNLPDGSGMDVCRKIRENKALGSVPIIMLTGQAQKESKLEGFSAGADQYLVKPLPPDELLMWVEALFRRQSFYASEDKQVQVGDLHIDLDARLVRFGDKSLSDLTTREFDLLYFIVKRRPKIVTRQVIVDHLWKTVAKDHLVDSHMSNLRRKLPAGLADKILTVPGQGFRYLE